MRSRGPSACMCVSVCVCVCVCLQGRVPQVASQLLSGWLRAQQHTAGHSTTTYADARGGNNLNCTQLIVCTHTHTRARTHTRTLARAHGRACGPEACMCIGIYLLVVFFLPTADYAVLTHTHVLPRRARVSCVWHNIKKAAATARQHCKPALPPSLFTMTLPLSHISAWFRSDRQGYTYTAAPLSLSLSQPPASSTSDGFVSFCCWPTGNLD